ncbi:MAG TPA: peptidoglycan DD-metalloendopeptidase family protein [Candidatus Mcinerneyibacteriales bacterium]|nr:peptidoglycan DD-metalloendopeptidase family protein [Candidatus Mcinerneyibacteriales bacterium]
MRALFILPLLLFYMFIPLFPQSLGADIRAKQKELDEIERQLRESREKTEYFSLKEGDLLEQLQKLQARIDRGREEKARLERHVRETEKELVTLDEKGAELQARKESLSLFLKAVFSRSFINWKQSQLETFIPDTGIRAGRDSALLRILGHFNYYILMENIKTMKELGYIREETSSALERLTYNLLSAKVAEKKLVRLDREKSAALTSIRSKKQYYLQLADELQKQKEALTGLIRDLEKKGSAYSADVRFADLKGILTWPVQGALFKNFGKNIDATYKTVLTNDGIDITAAFKSPVRAVAAGKVIYARSFKSYGTMVILDHGENYFTIYSNLASARVAEGDVVSPRDIIGLAGRDILSDTPLIHFEIRKEASPLSPLDWLAPRS